MSLGQRIILFCLLFLIGLVAGRFCGEAVTAQGSVYRITWYGEETGNGPLACGSDIYGHFDPYDVTTVATPWVQYDCGDRLRICTDVRCIVAIVKDKCGGCGAQHIDLSRGAWYTLGGRDYATVEKVGSAATGEAPAPAIAFPNTGTGGDKWTTKK